MKLLRVLFLCLPLGAQATFNLTVTVDNPTAVSVNTWRLQQVSSSTTLAASLDNVSTSVQFTDASQLTVGTHFLIDSEEFTATAIVGNAVTATRGVGSSVAAAHTANSSSVILILKYASATIALKASIVQLLRSILDQIPSSTISAELAKQATSAANITAIKTAAVQ